MNQKGQPGSPYKAEISANSGFPPLFPGLAYPLTIRLPPGRRVVSYQSLDVAFFLISKAATHLFIPLAGALADMTDVVYGIHSAGCVRRRTYDPGLIETPDFVCLRPNFHENELQRIRLPSCGSKPRALWKRTVTKWSIWKSVLEQNHRAISAASECKSALRSFWGLTHEESAERPASQTVVGYR